MSPISWSPDADAVAASNVGAAVGQDQMVAHSCGTLSDEARVATIAWIVVWVLAV